MAMPSARRKRRCRRKAGVGHRQWFAV